MTEIRSYFFSVLCTVLICGILIDLSEKTFFQKQLRMVGSVLLVLTILNPLLHIQLPELIDPWEAYLQEAREAAAKGEAISRQAETQLIKQETEAYILKEAKALGADIRIEITMEDSIPPIPVAAEIYGSYDADMENALKQILVEAARIPKESQTWIRQESSESGIS